MGRCEGCGKTKDCECLKRMQDKAEKAEDKDKEAPRVFLKTITKSGDCKNPCCYQFTSIGQPSPRSFKSIGQ